MEKVAFFEQYKHPLWQKKRLEMLEDAGWECSNCGDCENLLHVHHKIYIKGRKVWEYDQFELEVLCEKCHTFEHQLKDLLNALLISTDFATSASFFAGLQPVDCLEESDVRILQQANVFAYAAGFIAYLAIARQDIDEMYEIAKFASSFLKEDSEPFLRFTHDGKKIFGQKCEEQL